jgi:ribonuclease-3
MSDLVRLQAELGYVFGDPELLRLALTHPSVAHEQGLNVQHNQRLEFLGDAVLQLVLTRELYYKFPTAGEGPLTKARAQLVNRRTLADQARRLRLGQHLILSRGEELSGGRERASALADGFEAVIGAIFLDSGFDSTRHLILRLFREVFGELHAMPNLENPKGELQEILQSESPDAPQYCLASVSGPDHDREFECTVYYRGEELGRGKGKNKKAAESQAATAALKRIHARRALHPHRALTKG